MTKSRGPQNSRSWPGNSLISRSSWEALEGDRTGLRNQEIRTSIQFQDSAPAWLPQRQVGCTRAKERVSTGPSITPPRSGKVWADPKEVKKRPEVQFLALSNSSRGTGSSSQWTLSPIQLRRPSDPTSVLPAGWASSPLQPATLLQKPHKLVRKRGRAL